MLIASTDVHEHAITVISRLLCEAGAEMINIGAEKNPDEVASEACAHRVEAILISTHNGMALEYASHLKEELRKRNAAIPVLMGGILNQKYEHKVLPVNVAKKVRELGFHVSAKLDGGFRKMLEFGKDRQEVME